MDRRSFLSFAASAWPAALLRGGLPASADSQLDSLLEHLLEERFRSRPEDATVAGLDDGARAAHKYRLDDRSPQAAGRELERVRSALASLSGVDRRKLGPQKRIDHDVVRYQLESEAEALSFDIGIVGEYGGNYNPHVISPLNGAYQKIPDLLDTQHTIANKADADSYLARLQALGPAIDQDVDRMAYDAGRGIIPSASVIDVTVEQTRLLRQPEAEETTFVRSLVRRTGEAAVEGAWGEAAAQVVRQSVFPALERQLEALLTLRHRAGSEKGVWRFKDGEAYYAAAVRSASTTRMSPAEVHALGLDRVAEYSSRLDALLRAQGLSQGTVTDRMASLSKRSDQHFPEGDEGRAALIDWLRVLVRRAYEKLPLAFLALPKSPFEVKRVPISAEAGSPPGYYTQPSIDGSRPGLYWINLRKVGDWPKYALPTLTHHEMVPGHHLQISLAQENEAIPLLRRITIFSAYAEGWAVYSEQLADELGLFEDDPLAHLAYVHGLLGKARRLVIDTGLHHLRWSSERAAQQFNPGGKTPASAARELNRYSVWPGQATAYETGHMAWVKLRESAMRQLGRRFNLPAFHHVALKHGSLPLTVLEQIVEDWSRVTESGRGRKRTFAAP